MLVIDCHVHSGWEKPEKIIAEMNRHGIDRLVLFSPYPGEITNEYSDAFVYSSRRQREVARYVAEVQKEYPRQDCRLHMAGASAGRRGGDTGVGYN